MTQAAEAIARGNASFGQYFEKGDPAAVAALYTSDAQLFPPGSEVVTGRGAIEGFWKAVMDMGIAGVRLETSEIVTPGDTAIETGRYVLRGADGAELDNGKYLVVWRQEGGEWRLHRDIWNTSQAG